MAKKTIMKVGARVHHKNDRTLNEGVVVFISSDPSNINVKNGNPCSVHWSNGKRGNYSINEIARIPTNIIAEQIKKEVLEDDEE